jgi:hypothetical protein
MKTIYEAIKSSSIAYITLHDIPLELQLPPHLDQLLRNPEEEAIDFIQSPDDDETSNWGQELGHGWQLPSLTPWKSLLLLRGQELLDSYIQFSGSHLISQDRLVAESLIRFIKTVNVTLSYVISHRFDCHYLFVMPGWRMWQVYLIGTSKPKFTRRCAGLCNIVWQRSSTSYILD